MTDAKSNQIKSNQIIVLRSGGRGGLRRRRRGGGGGEEEDEKGRRVSGPLRWAALQHMWVTHAVPTVVTHGRVSVESYIIMNYY